MNRILISIIVVLNCCLAHAFDSPQALQDAFVEALANEDADGLAACYAEDATNYPVGEMVETGPDSVRASWDGFFAAYDVIDVSLTESHLETHGEIAVAWGLFHMTVTPKEGGEPEAMHGRYMDVARNFDGKWLYVADHASMPLPPGE